MEVRIEPRNLTMLPEWEERINKELSRVNSHNPGLIHHARVALMGTPHHKLGAFEVHVNCTVPEKRNIVVKKKGELVLPLLVEAFDALDLELREYNRTRQEVVREEPEASRGIIVRLFPEEDYGFIMSEEDYEVYFHKNAVKDTKFQKLSIDDRVEFGEEAGDEGPQATWVRRI